MFSSIVNNKQNDRVTVPNDLKNCWFPLEPGLVVEIDVFDNVLVTVMSCVFVIEISCRDVTTLVVVSSWVVVVLWP